MQIIEILRFKVASENATVEKSPGQNNRKHVHVGRQSLLNNE